MDDNIKWLEILLEYGNEDLVHLAQERVSFDDSRVQLKLDGTR